MIGRISRGAQGEARERPEEAPAPPARPHTKPLSRAHSHHVAIPEAPSAGQVKNRDAVYRRLLGLADVLAATTALLLATFLLSADDKFSLALFAGVPLVVLAGKIIGLYDRDEHLLSKTTLDEAPALFQVATLYTLVLWLGEDLVVQGKLGKDQVLGVWALLFLFLLVGRVAARQTALSMTPVERCLVVGDAPSAERVSRKLDCSSSSNAVVVGRVPLVGRVTGTAKDPVLGEIDQLGMVLAEHDVHRVIISPRNLESDQLLDVIRLIKAMGVKVSVLPRMFEVVGSSARFDDVEGMTLLGVPRFGLTKSSLGVKRAMDILGSGLAILLFAPLMAIVALAVKVSSPGPMFFHQTRIGRHGKRFEMLKFRTMVDGAEQMKSELDHLNEADGLWKIADDPRITSVGHILRKLSLDELPQLLNVFRGDMSLVGPRPLVDADDRLVEGWHRRRLDVPPGMTGVWQVLGSARVPLNEMVTLDYLYAANWSVWLDIKILLRTVAYVAARKGM